MSAHQARGIQDYFEDDYTRNMLDDLQLAAELGKTLLERNKELEIALKQHQNVIEDQAQEIEYLTKQTVALREVSDSRLRIYEQLEVSIQDLERANHRLVLENSAGKKHIKTLTTNIEGLEARCEDLQTTIDDLRLQVDVLKKRAQRPAEPVSTPPAVVTLRHVDKYVDDSKLTSPESNITRTIQNAQCVRNSTPIKTEPPSIDEDKENNGGEGSMEQISQLLAQLRECKTQTSRDHRRITELEEQLATMIQQNQALENQVIQLHHRDDDMKSMYDELSTLEEVRKGQMCSRCLRNVDRSSDDVAEEDDSSILDNLITPPPHRSSFSLDVQEHPRTSPPTKETGNLYKDLVEKYEALLEVHRQPMRNPKRNNCVSLQEELQMSSDFVNTKDTDEESGHGDSLKPHPKARMTFSHTPTDFSEAETSSSGFSDETSNKSTQTDERQGSFLCTIADGDDRFTIYDDASPISSRFKNQPEYQELFKEIFTVLKNTTVKTEVPSKPEEVTPSTIVTEEVSQITELDDDSQSIVSSTMSELSLSQAEPTTIIENIIQAQNQPIPEAEVQEAKPERVLKPLVRQPLEYVSVEVRKRSSSRRKNKFAERSDSPVTHIIGSPKINYSNRPTSGRRRRDFKNCPEADAAWNGNTVQFWSSNRNLASPTPSQGSGKFEYRPSLASQELHKLKKLDLSYAEVVRKADNKKQVARQRRK
ncbi:cerebellar degeneration-related protein 2-like isoform X4 [Tenebrio molitor]|uniref:cerebellar degeneration-related protein 2-like isoform X4 n=1 Tax=Tenebrio molitor TaxID=7067 RepID=UPI00362494A8